jgi:hypothetical protein
LLIPNPVNWIRWSVLTFQQSSQSPKKQFSFLWWSIGDGFAMNDIQPCSDNHANTLTVILDTKGNIFRGFPPMDWESRVERDVRGLEQLPESEWQSEEFLFPAEESAQSRRAEIWVEGWPEVVRNCVSVRLQFTLLEHWDSRSMQHQHWSL